MRNCRADPFDPSDSEDEMTPSPSMTIDYEMDDEDDCDYYNWSAFESDCEVYDLPCGFQRRSTNSWPQTTQRKEYLKVLRLAESNVSSDREVVKSAAVENGYVLVRYALFNNNTGLAKLLLEYGAAVKSQYLDESPLHIAAQKGYEEIVQLLVTQGANVNAKNSQEETPLHKAVGADETEITDLLINCNADVNAALKDGTTALFLAVERGNEELVNLLLSNGAKVCARVKVTFVSLKSGFGFTTDVFSTPLLTAVEYGHENIAKILLEHGANVNDERRKGETVLNLAVETGCSSIVDLVSSYSPILDDGRKRDLFKYLARVPGGENFDKIMDLLFRLGLEINDGTEDVEVLHGLIENGHTDLVDTMLKKCNRLVEFLNMKSPHHGYTSLHVACKYKRLDICKMLIRLGVDINARDALGKTALHHTAPRSKRSYEDVCVEIASLLLSSGADVTAKTNIGHTTLWLAIFHNYDKLVQVLLNHEKNVDQYFESKSKVLNIFHLSILRGNVSIITSILKKGADVNVRGKTLKNTALHGACMLAYDNVTEVLLQHPDIDVNAVGDKGRTPLHIAAAFRSKDVVLSLLDRGAKVNVKDDHNCTPLHKAAERCRLEIISVLLSRGAEVDCINSKRQTPLHLAAPMETCALLLLQHGASVNSKDENGNTQLHCAAMQSNVTTERIFERGGVVDVNVKDNEGKTALHHAAKDGYPKNVLVLLKNGADVNSRDELGHTALYIAADFGHFENVSHLLEHGSDVNIGASVAPFYTPLKCAEQKKGYVRSFFSIGPEAVVKALRRIILRMSTLNPHSVNEMNFQCVNVGKQDLIDFRAECENELPKLKLAKLGESNISLYDFMTIKRNNVAHLTKMYDIASMLQTKHFKASFPVYGKLIELRLRMAEEREKLLQNLSEKRNELIRHAIFRCANKFVLLPDICVEIVTEFLNNNDLKNLAEAWEFS